MKIINKEADTSVNVSKVHHGVRVFQILGGLCVLLIGIYVLLGFAVRLVVPYVPASLENQLGQMIKSTLPITEHTELESYEAILTKLIGADEAEDYDVFVISNTEFNAYAVPGKKIAICTGMTEEGLDEETIAFVLAHELGHFENHDHMNQYGRMLVLTMMVQIVTGSDSDLTNFATGLLATTEMKFSQNDELKADAYGVQLLYDAYGSYEGAVTLFNKVDDIQDRSQLQSYFDSHPHPEKRIEAIVELMKE